MPTSLTELLDCLPVPAFLMQADALLFANRTAQALIETPPTDAQPVSEILLGLTPGIFTPPHCREPQSFEASLLTASGQKIALSGSLIVLSTDPPTTLLLALEIGSGSVRGTFMEGVLASLPEAIAVTRGTAVLYTNPEFTRLFGYTVEEAVGRDLADLVLPVTREHESEVVRYTVLTQGRAAIETVRHRKDGELVDVSLVASPLIENGMQAGLCLSYRDIRDRKAMEAQLQHSALHDTLTGLPNRALFLDRLKLSMARRTRRSDQGFGVMFLDLDKFKEINDSLGHAAGDAVLIEVASRLTSCIRPQDTAARLSGDEFAVLLDNVHAVADMQVVASRITSDLARPFEVQDRPLLVGASIGVALCGADHRVPEQLVRDADFAMYRAKQQGGGRYEIFDRFMQVDISSQQELERELRRVLENREFAVWYQPFFRVQTGKLEGFESLLRWRRNDGSFDSFRDLLALAEGTGLSITINRETMLEGCAQLHAWAEKWPAAPFTLSINLSGRQFYHPALVTLVTSVLAKSQVDPKRLMFEIPEVALNETPDTAVAILDRLVDLGVRIAVDNFGAGLAPINHLVRLPISMLKLDPRLTAAATEGTRQSAVLSALIQLGRSLGVEILAQSVETESQLTILRDLGCDQVQGFHFAPAVSAMVAGKMIERGTWHPPTRSAKARVQAHPALLPLAASQTLPKSGSRTGPNTPGITTD